MSSTTSLVIVVPVWWLLSLHIQTICPLSPYCVCCAMFCFPSEQICAFLAALNYIHYFAHHMSGGVVPRLDKLLPQSVTGLEAVRNVCSKFFRVFGFLCNSSVWLHCPKRPDYFFRYPPSWTCCYQLYWCFLWRLPLPLTQVLSKHLNQWLGAVPAKGIRALLSTSSM